MRMPRRADLRLRSPLVASRFGQRMSSALPNLSPARRTRPRRTRAAWRQWLIEAERGLTAGFRSDSVFFVHLFLGCLAVAAALMFGLSATQWAVLVLALSVTTAAELFHQVLKQLGDLLPETAAGQAAKIRRLATAAVAVAMLGSAVAAAVVLGSRLWTLLAG